MTLLEELKARKKVKQEKKYNSLETELTELTKDPSVSFVSPTSRESEFFSQSDRATASTKSVDRGQDKESLDALVSTTAASAGAPVEASTAVTEPLPTRIEIPEPSPKDRLCYECQYFQRSPYGYPLGLCQQHGNRVQHSTSQPTQFGCGEFTFRQPSDGSRVCTECRHYNDMSTMCSVVNTGCPYPSIPQCSGEKFQHRLKSVNTNKEARDHNKRLK